MTNSDPVPGPKTTYYLSSTFSHNCPRGPRASRPTVSPSGAHAAYLLGSRLIVRALAARSSSSPFSVSYLAARRVVDLTPALNGRPASAIYMAWDSSYFHLPAKKTTNSTQTSADDTANEGKTATMIEDRLAVAIGLTVYVFLFDSHTNQQAQESIRVLPDGAECILRLPVGLILPSSAALRARAPHKTHSSRNSPLSSLQDQSTAADPALGICGVQWLQGHISHSTTSEPAVRLWILIGDHVAGPVAAALCSTSQILQIFRSPKPNNSVHVIGNIGDFTHYYSQGQCPDSLFAVVTRDGPNDTIVLFDLAGTIFPHSLTLEHLDSRNVTISPSGLWIASSETPAAGYSVSLHATLGDTLPLHTYQGPYAHRAHGLDVYGVRTLCWTCIDSHEYLLVGDATGRITVLAAELFMRPILVLLAQNADNIQDEESNPTTIWLETVDENTGLVRYAPGFSPYSSDVPATNNAVLHMCISQNYVAVVVRSSPHTVSLWQLSVDSPTESAQQHTRLVALFSHTSPVTRIQFRDMSPTATPATAAGSARKQLLIVPMHGHIVGLWDSASSTPPDILQFVDLLSEELDTPSSVRNTFGAAWVNSQSPDEFGVVAWNSRAFTLFHKTLVITDSEHFTTQLADFELEKQRQGSPFITNGEDAHARELEAEVKEREWGLEAHIAHTGANDPGDIMTDDTFVFVNSRRRNKSPVSTKSDVKS